MKDTKYVVCAVAAVCTLPAAAEERRSLDAHEHGHGELNIAIEGDRIAMELEVPGFDIVGFEHVAESEEDRAAVQSALLQLAKPLDLFALPGSAGCEVVDSHVEHLVESGHDEDNHDDHAHEDDDHGHGDDEDYHEHGHDDEDDDHGHEGEDGHDDHGHEGEDDDHGHENEDDHDERGHGDGATHSEFHAEYLLSCSDVGSANQIELRYFETFGNAESLTVQFVAAQGATLFEATRENPTLDLSDAMQN